MSAAPRDHEQTYATPIAYGTALAALLAALLLRWYSNPVLGERALYSSFLPAVMLAAYFGGFWPGFAYTMVCALLNNFLLVPPQFVLEFKGPGDTFAAGLFVLTGIFISVLSESFHRAQRRIVVTERQKAEEALRASEDRFRQMAENIHEIFWLMDAQYADLIYVSPRYEEIWGRSRQELYESPKLILQTLHPDDRAAMLEMINRRKQGLFTEGEYRILRPDGAVRWIRSRAFPVSDEEGALVHIAGLAEDITDRKRGEEALRHAKDTAESASRAKDDFLANVSHEIRTPMNAILGMTELVLSTQLDKNQQQSLRTVHSAAENLLSIINDLLDFSKIEAGKLELDHTEFSLRTAIDDTVQALRMRAEQKGLILNVQVSADVPDRLVGDPGRLRQVLLNLLGNAVKFTEQGVVTLTVELVGSPEPANRVQLRFKVVDTGIGISPEHQKRIFDAFEQADTSTTRKFGGTGLGLTISAQLVALMGGSIRVESTRGQGSAFSFTAQFALQPQQQAFHRDVNSKDTTIGSDAALQPEQNGATRKLRILVAEDNEFNIEVLTQHLSRAGHQIRIARDGRTALDLALNGQFDLLLLDIHMPEMDGFEVVQGLRQSEKTSGKHLPVVALTARSGKEDRRRCLAAGMDEFLAKPIQGANLQEVIKRLTSTTVFEDVQLLDLIDPAAVYSACGGDEQILKSICSAFQTGLRDQLVQMNLAIDAGDSHALREAAHKLCGTLSAFSPRVAAVASELEERASTHSVDDCDSLGQRLRSLSLALIKEVDDFATGKNRLFQSGGFSTD
jgi:two-component system sensor histidine kinase/response regulator